MARAKVRSTKSARGGSAPGGKDKPAAPKEVTPEAMKPKWSLVRLTLGVSGSVVILLLVSLVSYFGFEYVYADVVYPGITLAGQPLGGNDYATAAKVIDDYKAQLKRSGLKFTYQDHSFTLPFDSDNVPLIAIDTDKNVQAAFGIGRSKDTVENLADKFTAFTIGKTVPLVYDITAESITDQLSAEFDDAASPAVDAQLVIADGTVTVQPHTDGKVFDWDAVMEQINDNLSNLEPIDLTLQLSTETAQVTTAEAEAHIPQAEQVLALAPLTLTYEDKIYTIESDELAGWLVAKDTLALDEDALRTSLAPIAGEIDVPVHEGRFSLDLVNGEVELTQFEEGQYGLGVNIEKTIAAITTALLEQPTTTVELIVEVTEPRATPTNLSDLGITELLGTGETNFANSPYNRILNIRKGADMLNGLLIAPGETFSLLDALKPIDTAHGWFSELVIKGDKLEKEAGGGLCQVGSTSFRAAMLSGLPIVERRNHSWAISYYAYNGKAGVDATIYDPSPDFKFLNDTGHYILWRSRIEGTNIYFEFWGTSDGRKGYFTTPTNYNYVSPGGTIETVDENAAPGSRTCDGHAFTGLTASFDYIIERADGTKETENFTSVYKARPQLCIVGPTEETVETTEEVVEEAPVEEETTTNTNTNSNSNTNSGKKKKD